VGRLAPDLSHVELTMLPKGRDEYKLLEAIGRETANVHLGCTQADRLLNWLLGEKFKEGC
jgi:hypothetical protein